MSTRIAAFSGEIPRVIPRLLDNNYAQVSQNTKLEDGSLLPVRRARYVNQFDFDCKTFYLTTDGEWMGWPDLVRVAPGPVAEDRLYVTGDGVPKVIANGTTYPLAVPFPKTALTTTIISDTENVRIDSKVLSLKDGESGNTNGGHAYSVELDAKNKRLATITFDFGTGVSGAVVAALIDSFAYRNSSAAPTKAEKKVSIISITDNGTERNKSTFTDLYSLIRVAGYEGDLDESTPDPIDPDDTTDVNDYPLATTTPLNPAYAAGAGFVAVFTGTVVDPVDAGQLITGLVLQVTNLVNGEVDNDLSSTVIWTYTWITSLDEESEPAPLSAGVLWSPGIDVLLSGFEPPPAGRGIDRMRIYRSQTSASGETGLYFIKERDATTEDFLDVVADNPINELLPSTDYNAPPDDLQGLTSLPNGMMAGFVGKKLYFSEPYRPHAWPEKYILTCDYQIVGLGVFGTSVAIMTKGYPYVAQGTAPENMTMDRIRVNYPCISASSIVDLGYSVAYASPQGLVTISQSGAVVATASLMTRDQWRQMQPESFIAGQFAGRYLASYAFLDSDNIERRGIISIDLSGSQPFLERYADYAGAMFFEIGTGVLYLLRGGREIFEWDSICVHYAEMYWRSKRFVSTSYYNWGAILIEGEDASSDEQIKEIQAKNAGIRARNRLRMNAGNSDGALGDAALGIVTFAGSLLEPLEEAEPSFSCAIYGDGVLVATVYRINQIERLPGKRMYTTLELEIRGNQRITGVTIAGTPEDIAGGA